MRNRKGQTAVCSYAFAVSPCRVFKFQQSVQFISFLFSQNIIQYKNAYRNCKLPREPRGNQKAYEAWAPHKQMNNKVK